MGTASLDERREMGRAARAVAPRSSHAEWVTPDGRPDPIAVIEGQNQSRLAFLVPVRHQRMGANPFAFYRGAAAIMAGDLASTPASGLTVQLGGDAHLSNFGAYASPERHLVVDANDFDETLRGPWEWDLKRLATSFTIAGQYLGFPAEVTRRATARVARAYRQAMAEYAEMGFLDLWYQTLRVEDLTATAGVTADELAMRIERFQRRAMHRTSLQAVGKLTEIVDGRPRIAHRPPVLFSLRDAPLGYDQDVLREVTLSAFADYLDTLDDARHHLVARYEVMDIGVKVVGVGSVGTRCLILLLRGRDEHDPLLLQAKEAGPSVLEAHLGPSPYPNHGQRVVEGQRLVQAQSDPFLGWTAEHIGGHHYYVRQLRDWKGTVDIEGTTPNQLSFYAHLCGRILARGHARSGDPVAISSYLGKGATFDQAITAFAEAYAAQNLEDYERFLEAIASGRLPVTTETPDRRESR